MNIDAKKTAGYQEPTLVIWNTVDPRFLNPDSAREEHRIYTLTSVTGVNAPFEDMLEIPGPKYPKEDRVFGRKL